MYIYTLLLFAVFLVKDILFGSSTDRSSAPPVVRLSNSSPRHYLKHLPMTCALAPSGCDPLLVISYEQIILAHLLFITFCSIQTKRAY